MSSTHLSEIDDSTNIGLIRTVLRSAGFRGSHAVADPEEKRAALTFLKSEFRNGISSENELLDRVPWSGVASALAVPSGQSREWISLPLAG
ncbi:hypothetical protein [Rhizobium leguminosarum]|uniref:hypothetical protein n=1 Tax=Rhizobium leguminosarum TaxID=384 RepID=UPI0013EED4D6|nr:hypothetical protein [Rhizobium leguminosarum]